MTDASLSSPAIPQHGLRVAFLSPEFLPQSQAIGGLGNYLNKMCRALVDAGHTPEVFVLHHGEPGVQDHHGIRVERVNPIHDRGWLRWGWNLPRRRGFGNLRRSVQVRSGAAQLAAALEAREREKPFDLVQSSDVEAPGLFVRPRIGRPHLVRCSVAFDLWSALDDRQKYILPAWQSYYEHEAVRRADIAYAPSALTARYYEQRLHRKVHIVRPPALLGDDCDGIAPPGLPAKYLLHFGELRLRKGTKWLAEALPPAWGQAPDLKIVLAGRLEDFDLTGWRQKWGVRQDQVIYLGQLPKAAMYAVLRQAAGAVLPSLCDNLPNTVIESLMLGIPVLGTRRASLDELVDDGVTGELVAQNDVPGLARGMVRMWRGESVQPGFRWDSPIAREMRPQAAVDTLLALAASFDPRHRYLPNLQDKPAA